MLGLRKSTNLLMVDVNASRFFATDDTGRGRILIEIPSSKITTTKYNFGIAFEQFEHGHLQLYTLAKTERLKLFSVDVFTNF
jgi:hypothetical protein